jgi:hypothetical protein
MLYLVFILILFLFRTEIVADDMEYICKIIGMNLQEAYNEFGPPDEIFPLRGEEEWHDDVVFYYNNNMYLFWYQNRVWQVRYDERYSEEFLGLKMGMTKEDVITKMGDPFSIVNNSLIYNLMDRGYPIRLRIFFDNNKLNDAYIYRADF